MQTAFIARDASAADLRFNRLQVAPVSLTLSPLAIMIESSIMLRTIQNRAVTLMSKTPPTLEDLKAKRQRILAIFEKHGATDVKVFGSVARGDANPNSDIDFLCTVPNPRLASPWFPGGGFLNWRLSWVTASTLALRLKRWHLLLENLSKKT